MEYTAFDYKKINSLSSFKQAVRRHLIDKLVNRHNSDFLYDTISLPELY